jgi:hypothetical protein
MDFDPNIMALQLDGIHWWKKGLQSRFVKAINPGFRNRD